MQSFLDFFFCIWYHKIGLSAGLFTVHNNYLSLAKPFTVNNNCLPLIKGNKKTKR